MVNVINLESSSIVTKLEKRWPLSSSEGANKFSADLFCILMHFTVIDIG